MTGAPAYSAASPKDLAAAIRWGDITLHYQPKISLATNQLIGVEALARWSHPRLGMVPPSHFIPLAEAQGLIDDLTRVIVDMATRQGAAWRRNELDTSIAINVSARNLDALDFPDMIEEICQTHSLHCQHLTIELTESATQSVVHLLDTLTRIRIKGAQVSLDDFGTGYSSMVQLHQLPFSEMKIDRSFVIGMDTSKECRTIVKSIIDLAHNLGLRVVAEGVETGSALSMLRDLGCDAAQGYLIAKPMPPADLDKWLNNAGHDWVKSE